MGVVGESWEMLRFLYSGGFGPVKHDRDLAFVHVDLSWCQHETQEGYHGNTKGALLSLDLKMVVLYLL
jgi:hypothetical protein